MTIEHLGLLVSNPIQMGKWYKENLGFQILREAGTDTDGVVFMEDDRGTVIEIGRLPEASPLDVKSLNPLAVHLAVQCSHPENEARRLVEAGAEMIGESPRNAYKGEKILVRDPWGLTIQVVNRTWSLE